MGQQHFVLHSATRLISQGIGENLGLLLKHWTTADRPGYSAVGCRKA